MRIPELRDLNALARQGSQARTLHRTESVRSVYGSVGLASHSLKKLHMCEAAVHS